MVYGGWVLLDASGDVLILAVWYFGYNNMCTILRFAGLAYGSFVWYHFNFGLWTKWSVISENYSERKSMDIFYFLFSDIKCLLNLKCNCV